MIPTLIQTQHPVQILDLSGPWEIESRGGERSLQCTGNVPGCIHTDLLAAGLIDDPYYRDNELRLQWIGETDWTYRRNLEATESLLAHENIILRCEGLDTLAELNLNGHALGKTDNMHRTWTFDLKPHLRQGSNELEIRFQSPIHYGKARQKDCFLHPAEEPGIRIEGANWVRKQTCNYGWDWGPVLLTMGIWRPISIQAWSGLRFGEINPRASLTEDQQGRLDLSLDTLGAHPQPENHVVQISLARNGVEVCALAQNLDREGSFRRSIDLGPVDLWWPAGMGEQALYVLKLELLDEAGNVLDGMERRLGFRRLELIQERDAWGLSFHFRANGIDFFAKGSNWIPADTFDNRVSDDDLRDLLESARAAHMNMIRVWGGGLYERDAFYDLCDEFGLCVWQDFAFAGTCYPLHDEAFLENIRAEAIENVRRLRHHPCIALWCGNNELEHMPEFLGDFQGAMPWHHYCNWFDRELRQIVESNHPETPYWPSSDHSPVGPRAPRPACSDPRWGDVHLWNVWHGKEPFEWYRSSFHRFCSEFGFQGIPHPATMASVTRPEERNITSRIMERHQRSPNGNHVIMHYLTHWFRMPSGFESTVWLSQIQQTFGIKYAVEHWRRNMPRCMGALYWQLNDCWPVVSWSSIDSLHRWKALHYAARHFFAPDLISLVEEPEHRRLEIHLTSDNPSPREAVIRIHAWSVTTGNRVDEQVFPATIPANGSIHAATYEPAADAPALHAEDVLFQAILEVEGVVVSENMACFVRPKHLDLAPPAIQVQWDDEAEGILNLTTNLPALWVWLDDEEDPDARWSDNFFHLYPGQVRRIAAVRRKPVTRLPRVHSLYDTYQPPRKPSS